MTDVKLIMQERYSSLHTELQAMFGGKPSLLKFELFESFYTDRARIYHNFDHLNQMYTVHDSLSNMTNLHANDKVYIELFIWWHDIIYQPWRTDNEYLSALLFGSYSNKAAERFEISNAILASTHTGKAQDEDPWVQYCLDLDLSAMANTNLFKENGIKIRNEFKHLPYIDFNRGRRSFFEKLLTHEKIFYNPFDLEYFNVAEWTARGNIEML